MPHPTALGRMLVVRRFACPTNWWTTCCSGNDNIYELTNQDDCEIRFDFTLADGTTAYAKYAQFRIQSSVDNYELFVRGYTGTAGQ